MMERERVSPLDGRAARLIAIAIALCGIALLGWIHRADLFPGEAAPPADNPEQAAFQACFAPQAARIAGDTESGQISVEQAEMFKSRAMAFCADQAKKGSAGPRLPGQ